MVLRSGKKYFICFVDDLFLFPIVKDFQNRLTIDEIIAKVLHGAFVKHGVYRTTSRE